MNISTKIIGVAALLALTGAPAMADCPSSGGAWPYGNSGYQNSYYNPYSSGQSSTGSPAHQGYYYRPAHQWDPRFQQAQAQIHYGLRSGALSWREARELREEERRIANRAAYYGADGLSRQESRSLDKDWRRFFRDLRREYRD